MNQGYYYNPHGQNGATPPQYYQPQPDPYQQAVKRAHKKQKEDILAAGLMLGATIMAYLIIQTIAVSALKSLGLQEIYDSSSAFQNLFNILAVHICSMLIPFGAMALIMKKRFVTPIIPTAKLKPLTCTAWIFFGWGCAYLADIVTAEMIALFRVAGYELTKHESLNPSSVFDCIAAVLAVAIIPGIVEELSMRCFAMGILRRHGKPFAIFAVSIVFGLLHGNVIQFVFAFLVGIVLAYVTIKTDSIVPAMFIHGINNGMSVLRDIATYAFGAKVMEVIVAIAIIALAITAIVSLIYLIVNKEFAHKGPKTKKSPYDLSFGTKLLCLTPGMIIPIIMLVIITTQTITKISV